MGVAEHVMRQLGAKPLSAPVDHRSLARRVPPPSSSIDNPAPHIPVFSFNSPIFLEASVLPMPSVSTLSPASLAIAAM